MNALEKAARAMREYDRARALGRWNSWEMAKPEHRLKYIERARAVISSIEVDDAMVEAALGEAGQIVNAHNRSRMRASLKAALHSILVDGEGK